MLELILPVEKWIKKPEYPLSCALLVNSSETGGCLQVVAENGSQLYAEVQINNVFQSAWLFFQSQLGLGWKTACNATAQDNFVLVDIILPNPLVFYSSAMWGAACIVLTTCPSDFRPLKWVRTLLHYFDKPSVYSCLSDVEQCFLTMVHSLSKPAELAFSYVLTATTLSTESHVSCSCLVGALHISDRDAFTLTRGGWATTVDRIAISQKTKTALQRLVANYFGTFRLELQQFAIRDMVLTECGLFKFETYDWRKYAMFPCPQVADAVLDAGFAADQVRLANTASAARSDGTVANTLRKVSGLICAFLC